MSTPTPATGQATQDQAEQEQARALEEAIEKALDFSGIYADIERIEQIIEGLK